MPAFSKKHLWRLAGDFRHSRDGNIAIIFGITASLLVGTMGAGIDFSRAYLVRQKVSQVAILTCQYASRPSVVDTSASTYNGTGGGAAYSTQVNAFLTKTWTSQSVNLAQTNGAPFAYTQNGPASVSLSTSMPTSFLGIFQINEVPISVTTKCYDSPSSVPQREPDPASPFVVKEGFEAGGSMGWQVYLPDGTRTNSPVPATSTNTSSFGYTGSNGAKWRIMGYCLEQDRAGVISSFVFEGNNSVELDCDNGSFTKGNSSISTLAYLAAGNYELRYAYRSRVTYPNYEPAYICGSQASDVSWANETSNTGPASGARTNQINVYLDLNTASNQPPLHTTIDGQIQLAGSNLIDVCVNSQYWIQRSVKINVTTAGYYWLSFAADGLNDSFGGQLDDVQLCRISCAGTVQDNFPDAWKTTPLLFRDPFELMTTYSNNSNFGYSDLATSYGTFGIPGSGWPNAQQKGWRVGQLNDVNTIYNGAQQGTTSLELDSDRNRNGIANSNRGMTRSFLLDPGYYAITYSYNGGYTMSTLGSATYCGANPAAAGIPALTGTSPTSVFGSSAGAFATDSLIIGMFMSHDQMASYPTATGFRGIPNYTNPDGTTTSSPAVPYNGINLLNYDSSQPNPLIDICAYATSWQTRSPKVRITKPGYYWLTFSALGTSDNISGWIDDVKLTAVGSLYDAVPAGGAITIPVPGVQPNSTVSYTGFSITANPTP